MTYVYTLHQYMENTQYMIQNDKPCVIMPLIEQ